MSQTHKTTTGVLVLPTAALPSSITPTKTALTPLTYPPQVDPSALTPLYHLETPPNAAILVEILRFSPTYGSWIFVPTLTTHVPTLSSNPNLTLVTPVDPLFPALLLLDAHRTIASKPVFQPLDALCCTANGINLRDICTHDQFALLCQVKRAAGETFYQLDDRKAVAWLVRKHGMLAAHPRVGDNDALDIIAQYIMPKWAKLLRRAVLKDSAKEQAQPADSAAGARSLAMQVMMDDAKETNETKRALDRLSHQPPSKPSKKPTKKKVIQKAPSSSFFTRRKSSTKRSTK